jgi:uncharacterized protein (TIRG00374 family)
MRELTAKWLARIGSFGLAGLLLFLALRGVDLDEVWTALKSAQYWWMVPLAFITLLSHWIRAVRWKMLLEVLPERTPQSPPISTWNTFNSIMIGYMANYAGPRLGEVIRTGNVATRTKLPFTGVLGTVFVERVLDMAAFGIALLSIPFIFQSQTAELWHLLTTPTLSFLSNTATGWIVAAIAMTLTLMVLIAVVVIRAARNPKSRLIRFLRQFRGGLLSLTRTGKPYKMTFLTIAMWLCYGLMAYIPFILLGLDVTYGIGPVQAWGIMLIGALGVIVPSPGGIGTFHFVTIQSLIMLFSMESTEAATYALLAHSGQMLFYLLVGSIGILYLGSQVQSSINVSRKGKSDDA